MEEQKKSKWPFRILIGSLVSLVIGSVLLLSQMDAMDEILDPRDNNIAELNTGNEVQKLVEIEEIGCYRVFGTGFDGNVTISELDGSVIGEPLSESKCKLDWQAMASNQEQRAPEASLLEHAKKYDNMVFCKRLADAYDSLV